MNLHTRGPIARLIILAQHENNYLDIQDNNFKKDLIDNQNNEFKKKKKDFYFFIFLKTILYFNF